MITGPYNRFQEAFEAFQKELRQELHEELEAFKKELLEEIKSELNKPQKSIYRTGYIPPEQRPKAKESRQLVRLEDIEEVEPPPNRQLVNLEEIEAASEASIPQPRWCESCQKRVRTLHCPDCGEQTVNRFGQPPRLKRTIGDYTRDYIKREIEEAARNEQEHSENGIHFDDDPNDYDTDLTW